MFHTNNEIKKVWGKEVLLTNNELYCAKYLCINKGFHSSLHRHNVKDETFFIIEGEILLKIYPIEKKLKYFFTKQLGKKQFYRIKPNTLHQFCALKSDAVILEVSTHHEDADSIRLKLGGKIK